MVSRQLEEVLVELKKKHEELVRRLEKFQENVEEFDEHLDFICERDYKLISALQSYFDKKINILTNTVQALILSQMGFIGALIFFCLLNEQVNNPFGTFWWFFSLIALLFSMATLDSLKQLGKQEIKKVFTKEEFLKAVEKAKPGQEIVFDERWEKLDE